MPVRRMLSCLVLVTALVLAVPAVAAASAYTQVERAYGRSETNTIPPCEFSSATLSAALKEAPTYDFQYGADFTNAIQAALSARGDGDCSKTKARHSPSGATLKGADTQLPTSPTAPGSGGLPLVLTVAFALVGAVLVLGAGWLGFNALGYDPSILRAARHSLREAEYRIAAGWEDLADRLRRQ